MKTAFFTTVLLALCPLAAFPAVHYVNVSNSFPASPFTDWSSAATNIQDAINVASDGDVVLVTNGLYDSGGTIVFGAMSNRVAVTRQLKVQSVNGPAFTTIQGYQDPLTNFSANCVRCVYLTNGSTLIGFTLSGGATLSSGDAILEQSGAGVLCDSNNVTVSNCLFIGNTAVNNGGGAEGGNIYNCAFVTNSAGDGGGASDATIYSCAFTNNSAGDGGGARFSTLTNCTFIGNSAGDGGGGANSCTVNNSYFGGNFGYVSGGAAYASTVNNCIVVTNSSNAGGGAGFCSLNNSVLFGNSSGYGGGVLGGSVINCTITGSSGIGAFDADCVNCIIFDNPDGNWGLDGEIPGSFNFCCTTPLPDGFGNFANDPQLASFSHISAGSPCRGAGDFAYSSGVDIDGELWLNPPSVGCDEFYAADAHGPLSLTITAQYTNFPAGFAINLAGDIEGACTVSGWDFGDGVTTSNHPYTSHAWTNPGDYSVVLTAYNADFPDGVTGTQIVHVVQGTYYVSLDSPAPTPPYNSWSTAATNIQDAIEAASIVGGTILVSNGVYDTGGTVIYNSLTNRIAINKNVTVRSLNGPAVTTIAGYQDPAANFSANCVRCVYMTNGATLLGFTITNGATLMDPCNGQCNDNGVYQGGGIWCESTASVISNCVITGCFASDQGGGVMNATLYNCTVVGNHADVSASGYGGGAEASILNNCLFHGNTAYAYGGGADSATLNNCLLYGNSSLNNGGGANASFINNCTVVSNSASDGGGADSSTIKNSVCYYNSANSASNYDNSLLYNCCTTPDAGLGNITNEPGFVDPSSDNYHLSSTSPCINSGDNIYAPAGFDLDAKPRIVGGTVDVGAYENQTPSSVISYAYLQQYGLPTDGTKDYADLDGTSFNVYEDWIAGLNPTNAASVLVMLPPVATNNAAGITVSWDSVSGINYSLQRSTNLAAQPAFQTIQFNISGQTGTTSYSDLTATNNVPYFYRVVVQHE